MLTANRLTVSRPRSHWQSQKARRAFTVLAAVSALFAAYISLVPFDFRILSAAEIAQGLINALDVRALSIPNFVANIVLFVPFAFFAAATLQPRARPSARNGAIVAVAALLSLSIETLQIFVPGRTPSILDVIAQLAGTLLGLAGWWLLEDEAGHWLGQVEHGTDMSVLQRVLTVYAVGRALALLLPLDVTVSLSLLAAKYRSGGIRLVPFSRNEGVAALVQTFIVDMVLAAPIGALAVIGGVRQGGRRSLPSSIALATVFLGCLELAQVIVISRVADVTQVISGSLGATAGAIAFIRLVPVPGRKPVHSPARTRLAGLALGVSAGAYLIYNWSPFDFVTSSDLIRERLPLLVRVPFYGYYQNPEFHAAADFLTKALMAGPIGVAAGLFTADRMLRYPRACWFLLGLLAVGFFTAVEFGQVFLPQRYPDLTDVIIAMSGFVSGVLLARLSFKKTRSVPTQLPK